MFSHVPRCILKPAIGGRILAKYAVKCYLPLPAEYCLCLYIMEVKKDENGNLKAALKDTAIKDWQDPYHQECPMKW
jgi:hypothetical protein